MSNQVFTLMLADVNASFNNLLYILIGIRFLGMRRLCVFKRASMIHSKGKQTPY